MTPIELLDAKIIEHIKTHRAHPLSSPIVRNAAHECLPFVKQREPFRLINLRMKALADSMRIEYRRIGKRYVALDGGHEPKP